MEALHHYPLLRLNAQHKENVLSMHMYLRVLQGVCYM